MKKQIRKVELLVPAGNLEKLEIAIHYGADAVYLGGKNFNLRSFSNNFSPEEMYQARNLTSKHNVKMYVAVNAYSRDTEDVAIAAFLCDLTEIKPDAIITADPAIFLQARHLIPEIPIHISTQVNITNTRTVSFWKELGAKRVNVARELTLEEIAKIVKQSNIEIETFIHGSMCIAYSGRCLMSSFMTQREGNRGMCCQPCRFNYAVVEAKRPGEYFPVYEDKRGSYIFSSKDLWMIDYISDLIHIGITSFKIEGRMKSINYLATTTKIYREAIDAHYNNVARSPLLLRRWHKELNNVSNRGYCTGFFFSNPEQVEYNRSPTFKYVFIAKVLEITSEGKTLINVRNKVFVGDRVKIISPYLTSERCGTVKGLFDRKGVALCFAQPNMDVYAEIYDVGCKPLDLIQRAE